MGASEVDINGFGNTDIDPGTHRQVAVLCADRIATQHPHELDQLMPRLAGRTLAKDPAVRADLLELLDAIGYTSKERT